MAQNKGLIILVIILAIAGFFFYQKGTLFAISGTETMTRTAAPSTVNQGSTFTLTYTAIGTSGQWGASVMESVTGGCTFPSGSASYKTVMLSEDGLTKSVTITAPSAKGSCTFTGDYQYGTFPIKTFTDLTVQICTPVCTRPADNCVQASTVSNGCSGGFCTGSWTVTQNTNSDINCNNIVDRTELGTAITGWTAGTVTRTNLGAAIQAWATA